MLIWAQCNIKIHNRIENIKNSPCEHFVKCSNFMVVHFDFIAVCRILF